MKKPDSKAIRIAAELVLESIGDLPETVETDIRAFIDLLGPISKLCKCNSHENIDNTKIAAKECNAEERPDSGCGIKR